MFINPGVASFIVMSLTWFLANLTFLIYGLYTEQIGFILLFIVNIVIIFLGIFVKLDREEDEDQSIYE